MNVLRHVDIYGHNMTDSLSCRVRPSSCHQQRDCFQHSFHDNKVPLSVELQYKIPTPPAHSSVAELRSRVKTLKMWTTLSARRWMCLLALTVLVLFSASQADSSGQSVPCCRNFSSRKIHVIRECYEQQPRKNCDHAFLIMNRKGRWCIRPEAAWLKAKIATGSLRCPPDLSF